MSNLDSAKAAIHSELEQVRQGAEHYAKRVAALEEMLRHLSMLQGPATTSETPKKRGRKPGSIAALPGKAKRGRPAKALASSASEKLAPAGKAKASRKLPSTKGDFWKNQVTSEPRSWANILEGAIVNLGISPSAADRKKLQQRMIFAVNALVKGGEIKDSGAGRERRFFV